MAGPSTELKLFEALETYTNHDSFCSKASFVQNFLERDLDLNNTQQSLQIEDISEEDEEEEEEGDDSDGSSYLEVDTGNNTSLFEEDEKQQQPREGKRVTFLGGNGRDALLKLLLQKHHRRDEAEANETGSVRSDAVEEEEEVDEEEKQEVSVTVTEDEEEDEEEEEDEVDEEPEESDAVETQHKRNEPDSVENWNQYFQLLELKRALEEKQTYLEKEKENFSKMKGLEENRMKEEKKRVESQRKSLQKIMTDYNKIKFSKEEYEEKIKQLSDQLKQTKLQMNKRITRWGDQQRRLEERVKALEKENEELKKKDQRSIPARLAALKRPPMRCLTNKKPKEAPTKPQLKRVQFADSCERNEMEEEEIKENDNSKSVQDSSASSTSTFFSESFFRSPESQNKSRLEGSPGESNGNQNDSCPYEKDVHLSDDEADKTMPSDYKEIKHPCGTITRITNDNKLTRHILMNKDVMDEFEDSSVRYYYHELGFSQTTYPNGDEVIEYDSGEIETKRADGSKIYTYSNGLVKMIDGISGSEEVIFGDGSVMKKSSDGLCTTITWPSGQKEERTPDYVKRIYTNGTVKIMYKDGSEETRYFNGRVRRKDKNGVLVDDTKFSKKSKSNKPKATA